MGRRVAAPWGLKRPSEFALTQRRRQNRAGGSLAAGCCVTVPGREATPLALRLGVLMKAVVYEGPMQVRVEDVAEPVILEQS